MSTDGRPTYTVATTWTECRLTKSGLTAQQAADMLGVDINDMLWAIEEEGECETDNLIAKED